MNLLDELVAEVAQRPRRPVDHLQCHGFEPCGRCWWCTDGQRGRYIVGTGRYVDVTHGSRQAVVVLQNGAVPFRPEELARPYLRRAFAEGRRPRGMGARRVPWQRQALAHLSLLPPRYFVGGGVVGEWCYVDIDSAYPSIYSRLALDCVWRPCDDRPVLGVGNMVFPRSPEVASEKSIQRAVGGILRSTQIAEMHNGRTSLRSTVSWSQFLAPDLWGVIMWTLHAVARMAIDEFGAVMWDTDGGVVPLERAQPLREAIADRFHLASKREHEGPGLVWGVKHWQIGPDATRQGGPRRVLAADNRVLRPSPAVVECLTEALT